jgi:hypothetical protein
LNAKHDDDSVVSMLGIRTTLGRHGKTCVDIARHA